MPVYNFDTLMTPHYPRDISATVRVGFLLDTYSGPSVATRPRL